MIQENSFLYNLKIGDKIIVDLGNYPKDMLYREGIVESEMYNAPSGWLYIDISVNEKKYAVSVSDIYPLGTKPIIYKAYIYSKSYRGSNFSGRGEYGLYFEGKEIYSSIGSCTGRKDANKKLLNYDILNKYNITKVFSNDVLIYDKNLQAD